jgi:hypothetical protein
MAAAGPGRSQSRGGAFADQVAFELGQGGEHVEDELAAGGGGVDRLLEAAEPDAAVSQPGDGVDEMPEGAAEPVEFPDDQGVARVELGAGGAVGAGGAGRLDKHPVAAGRGEGVDLELGVLVGGEDASRCRIPLQVRALREHRRRHADAEHRATTLPLVPRTETTTT